MARNWRNDPQLIQRLLVRLAKNPPTFNYNPIFHAVRDLLVFGIDYEQVVAGIMRVKRQDLRKNYLELLPLIYSHFEEVSPDFVQPVALRKYPLSSDLMIPFEPPLVYGVGGQLWFPWFSFWKSNPLASESLSLFMTIVDEILLQDPDLEGSLFHILDFSAAKPGEPRRLQVMDSRQIPRVSETRKIEMLEIFAEGFSKAREELSADHRPKDDSRPQAVDYDQLSLF